ncbi:MAG: hypothetical protein UR66_C0001G0065 [Candidatus Moranbacteria bacterium GW2011_GWE1_35_17]|nr:MAG: hypothetical protein UR66_C0001G0065 [Candidatus Moranbacteria bacterium GW2011_GWE1_35_17]KKP85217.1 MAG: hypothetical protein UR83_C0003G0052 [Candidatus Moranbacteria bacterium GW2011_GWF2_35_54]
MYYIWHEQVSHHFKKEERAMKNILQGPTKMEEAVGKLVILNGKFIVIDTDTTQDEKGTAEIVTICPSNEEIEEKQIDFMVKSFASGGGGHFKAGNTDFTVSDIWRCNPSNDHMLKNHQDQTKIVVVKNEETGEFFLIMSEDVSIRAAKDFLQSINDEMSRNDDSPLIAITGGRYLSFPYEITKPMGAAGNIRFEVVTNNGLATIKLRL